MNKRSENLGESGNKIKNEKGGNYTKDLKLAEECIANNLEAVNVLYEQISKQLFGICLRYSDNKDEAQDFFQDGFVKIFENLKNYTGNGSLVGWCRMIITNTCINHYRKKLKTDYQNIKIESVDFIESTNNGEDALSKLEREEILKLVQGMPPGYRTVFNLFVIEGYKHKEISEILKISISTSKTQLKSARNYLKNKINHYNGEKL